VCCVWCVCCMYCVLCALSVVCVVCAVCCVRCVLCVECRVLCVVRCALCVVRCVVCCVLCVALCVVCCVILCVSCVLCVLINLPPVAPLPVVMYWTFPQETLAHTKSKLFGIDYRWLADIFLFCCVLISHLSACGSFAVLLRSHKFTCGYISACLLLFCCVAIIFHAAIYSVGCQFS